MLTVKEVAQRLNVSRTAVYALIEKQELAHVRIGLGRGTIRVQEHDLSAYLASRRHEPAAGSPRPKRLRLRHIVIRKVSGSSR